MNSIVFVLLVVTNNGHFGNYVIPTMEFSSYEKCQQAIKEFTYDSKDQTGTVRMRCVRIEK